VWTPRILVGDELTVIGITILGSGSRGNALVVHGESGDLLIDVGFSAKETRRRMAEASVDEEHISAILISHEHRDHVTGLRVLARQLDVPVYMNRLTALALKDRQDAPEKVHVFAAGTSFQIGALQIEPFTIPHDAVDPVGFAIHNANCKLTVATDLGHVSSVVKHHLLHTDIIVLESNHETTMLQASNRPWALKQRILGRHGHLSNDASMEVLRAVVDERTQHIVLAHASRECNEYSIVAKHAAACLQSLERDDIAFTVATQDQPAPTIIL